MRLPHRAEQDFVDPLPIVIDHKTMISVMRLQIRERQATGLYEYTLCQLQGIRAADPNHANPADAQRGGNSGYRIGLRRFQNVSQGTPAGLAFADGAGFFEPTITIRPHLLDNAQDVVDQPVNHQPSGRV